MSFKMLLLSVTVCLPIVAFDKGSQSAKVTTLTEEDWRMIYAFNALTFQEALQKYLEGDCPCCGDKMPTKAKDEQKSKIAEKDYSVDKEVQNVATVAATQEIPSKIVDKK